MFDIKDSLNKLATYVDHAGEDLKRVYRTLDFSSVGMDNGNADLRRYHQMTLYISGLPQIPGNTKSSNFVICSNLPETFSYTIGSEYEAPFSDFGSGLTNLLAQISTDGESSASLRASSIRIWSRSRPLSFTVNIPVLDDGFEGVRSNGYATNFMESLEVLGRMCLPRLAGQAQTDEKGNVVEYILDQAGALTPPPTPLTGKVSITTKDKTSNYNLSKGGTGSIDVQLGGMLLVKGCVLESMNVNYDNTKSMIRHDYDPGTYLKQKTGIRNYLTPMTAKLQLKFSTLTVLTSNAYTDMLWLNGSENSANTTASILSADFKI